MAFRIAKKFAFVRVHEPTRHILKNVLLKWKHMNCRPTKTQKSVRTPTPVQLLRFQEKTAVRENVPDLHTIYVFAVP